MDDAAVQNLKVIIAKEGLMAVLLGLAGRSVLRRRLPLQRSAGLLARLSRLGVLQPARLRPAHFHPLAWFSDSWTENLQDFSTVMSVEMTT